MVPTVSETVLKFREPLCIRPPGDKSLTHRALLLSALATGKSVISDPLVANDTRSTAAVLRTLGVRMSTFGLGTRLEVDGAGLDGLTEPMVPLDCGNSGTAARLLMGILSGSSITGEITGDDSLRTRPMRRVTEPLRKMGAHIEELSGATLPVVVRGRGLRSLDYTLPVASAQVKSALLFAGLLGRTTVTVREAMPTRDHTERMLTALGVTIHVADGVVRLQPIDSLPPFAARIPADPSSAAFLIAAALLSTGGSMTVVGVSLNPTRTAFLGVLQRMGAIIHSNQTCVELGEPVGDIVVRR